MRPWKTSAKKITSNLLRSQGIWNAIKFSLLVSVFPLLLLFYYLYTTNQDYYEYIFSAIFIVLGIAYLLHPYLSDYSELAKYVNQLSLNRTVKSPQLKSSTAIIELSESLKILRKSWERRQIELNQKVAESNLLFDTIPDILIMLNQNMVITRANDAAYEAFGKDIDGKNLQDIISNKTLLGCIRWVLHDKVGKQVEVSITESNSKEYLAKVEYYALEAQDQYNVLVMLHDITQRKRTEQMFADFVANASHEIRTPLTSIIGVIETLQNTGKNDPKAFNTFLPMIESQAERMKVLINELLDLSSIEKSLNTPPTDKIDILDIIDLAEKQLEWHLQEHKNKLDKKIGKNIPTIIGDFQQLTQVMHNLINNAIRYGKKNSSIVIKVDTTTKFPKNGFHTNDIKNTLYISVTDKGEGIKPEHLERITERFYRIDKSRSRKIGGTGLGLAIVKQVLNRHDAVLNIESKVGKGSTFTIYFPIKEV